MLEGRVRSSPISDLLVASCHSYSFSSNDISCSGRLEFTARPSMYWNRWMKLLMSSGGYLPVHAGETGYVHQRNAYIMRLFKVGSSIVAIHRKQLRAIYCIKYAFLHYDSYCFS